MLHPFIREVVCTLIYLQINSSSLKQGLLNFIKEVIPKLHWIQYLYLRMVQPCNLNLLQCSQDKSSSSHNSKILLIITPIANIKEMQLLEQHLFQILSLISIFIINMALIFVLKHLQASKFLKLITSNNSQYPRITCKTYK